MPDENLVESVECSAGSKPLKTIKLRCFKVAECSTRKVWFHKKLHHR
ncbi:general secretion pathway protein GspH [Vibrio cholerae]|nr:general secretion pathway protein GspH [Vibrio cholerae]